MCLLVEWEKLRGLGQLTLRIIDIVSCFWAALSEKCIACIQQEAHKKHKRLVEGLQIKENTYAIIRSRCVYAGPLVWNTETMLVTALENTVRSAIIY